MYISFAAELVKIAQLNPTVSLRQHQVDAVNEVISGDGRALLAHATGTGKTLSAIAAVEALREAGKAKKTLVITPASLQANFIDNGVKKFTNRSAGPVGSGADYQFATLETFRKRPEELVRSSGANTLVIDEIHRAKDPNTVNYHALRNISAKMDNVIGLTGSFVSNHPREVVPLLDIVHPEHELGSQPRFSKRFTTSEAVEGGFLKGPRYQTTLQRRPELGKKLQGRLHYFGHMDTQADMPSLNVTDVHLPMTDEQHKVYEFALGRLDPISRMKVKAGLPVNQSEAQHIFAAITKARQAANSIGTHIDMPLHQAAEQTPKLKQVMDDVEAHLKKTPDGQAVIYTNLVQGGADALHAGLTARGLTPGVFAGANALPGVSLGSRKQDVADFLSGDKRVMILTPAGGEGISLNNATFFAEVDRHYNPERNQQAISRGRRLGGLAHRPPEERTLEVKRYFSDPPQSFFAKIMGRKEVGVDQWIDNIAKEKDRLNAELRSVVAKRR